MKSVNSIYQCIWIILLLTIQCHALASGEHNSPEHEKSTQTNQHSDGHEHDDHGHDDSTENTGQHDDHDDHEKTVTIDEHMAKKSQLKTSSATSGYISKQLKIYGKTANDPSQVSHIRARFPGTIASVNVHIGDTVQAGDILAYVESNESLKKYPIKAMMDGVVLARHANPGEVAIDQVLFTLANFDQIWIELQIFPSQLIQVKKGQKVYISGPEGSVSTIINHIVPTHDEKPYSLARVLLNNKTHTWTTGLMVTGEVVIDEFEADLVVESKAIQMIENQTVVFIKENNSYTAQPVALGRSDGRNTEVLSGIKLGDEYVSENSYLIKADIEKAGAAHAH